MKNKNPYGFWKWLASVIEDKSGSISTKRVGFFLCLWIDKAIAHDPNVPSYVVWAFICLTFGCIGLTIPEWFSKIALNKNAAEQESVIEQQAI